MVADKARIPIQSACGLNAPIHSGLIELRRTLKVAVLDRHQLTS